MVFVSEETKVTKLMRPGEINAAILWKLMVLSAIVEAQAFQAGTSVNFEAYNKTIEVLTELYNSHDFVRESVQAVFGRMFGNTQSVAVA